MNRILGASLTVLLLCSCSMVHTDWEKAKMADTVSAYKVFLSKHPHSDFSGIAAQNIKEINELSALNDLFHRVAAKVEIPITLPPDLSDGVSCRSDMRSKVLESLHTICVQGFKSPDKGFTVLNGIIGSDQSLRHLCSFVFERGTEDYKNIPALWMLAAKAQDTNTKAIELLKRGLECNPKCCDLMLELAFRHLSSGRPQSALDCCNDIMKEPSAANHQKGMALIIRGHVAYLSGDAEMCERSYQEALRLEPELSEVVDTFSVSDIIFIVSEIADEAAREATIEVYEPVGDIDLDSDYRPTGFIETGPPRLVDIRWDENKYSRLLCEKLKKEFGQRGQSTRELLDILRKGRPPERSSISKEYDAVVNLLKKYMIDDAEEIVQGLGTESNEPLMDSYQQDHRLARLLVKRHLEDNARAVGGQAIESEEVGPLLDEYYEQLCRRFHMVRVTANMPAVVRVHARLLQNPKQPREQCWILNRQIREELVPEEKSIVLARYDGGEVTLEDWFLALCNIDPDKRPKDLDTVEGVDRILNMATKTKILAAEARLLGIDDGR